MADRPILFSGPMVRALLAGTKTQTRRAFKGVEEVRPGYFHVFGSGGGIFCDGEAEVKHWAPSYLRIATGDRLYVREHRRTVGMAGAFDSVPPRDFEPQAVWYVADGEAPGDEFPGKFRQGMHMPRWASRLTLTVTNVRVERLQDCSEEDARSEGIIDTGNPLGRWKNYLPEAYPPGIGFSSAVNSYATLWNSINGDGAWEANPWVAAYTFTVERRNIDQVPR